MSTHFTLSDARKLVRRQGHDPNSWDGTRRAMKLLRDPPHEDPQLKLFDDLLEHARESVTRPPAEVAR